MKATKSFLKELKKVAAELPEMKTDNENDKVYQWQSGSQLISEGITKLKNGTAIQPEGRYRKETNGIPVNHFKRMKNIYEDSGIERVQKYISEVFGINQGHASVINSLKDRLSKLI